MCYTENINENQRSVTHEIFYEPFLPSRQTALGAFRNQGGPPVCSGTALWKSAADFNHSYQSLYLQKREVSAQNIPTRAYVYDDFCYIFAADHDTCITTFPLPKWFNRGLACDGKERIRNVRKYQRLNPDCEAVA